MYNVQQHPLDGWMQGRYYRWMDVHICSVTYMYLVLCFTPMFIGTPCIFRHISNPNQFKFAMLGIDK